MTKKRKVGWAAVGIGTVMLFVGISDLLIYSRAISETIWQIKGFAWGFVAIFAIKWGVIRLRDTA